MAASLASLPLVALLIVASCSICTGKEGTRHAPATLARWLVRAVNRVDRVLAHVTGPGDLVQTGGKSCCRRHI